MITNFKIFEDIKERSVIFKNDIKDNDYVILDHHYFNYKMNNDDIIIGRIEMPKHINSSISKYVKFDDNSLNDYYPISKFIYWSESKEELLAFLESQKYNI